MKEINLRELAIACSTFSELTIGRDKIDVDKLISTYNGIVTIIGFDIIENNNDRYPIIIYAEDDTKFFFGGLLLLKLCDKLMEETEGTPCEISEYMKKIGGIKVQLEKTRTRNGNNLTKYIVI